MLRNYIASLFLVFFPFLVHAEYIESFDSQIEILKDSSFNVTETIEYVFTEERHGIFRYIPLTHPEVSDYVLKKRIIELDFESIKLDGNDVSFTKEGSSDQFYLKIGDPNVTITGKHTYTIEYQVKGGLSYPINQGAEFYFNVTGNGWEVPMKSVSARIFSPDAIFLQNRSCYRDMNGGNASCDQIKNEDGSVTFRTTELMPGEGVTIAQALDTTKVERVLLERFKLLWILIPLSALLFGVLGVFLYRFKTKYKTGRTIIPQYEPYPGVKPMYTGLLMDGRLDPCDITACIVYLAEQGFLKIKKTEKKVLFLLEADDYEITLLKPIDGTVNEFEHMILSSLLFSNTTKENPTISLSSLQKKREGNRAILSELKTILNSDLVISGFYQKSDFSEVFRTLFFITFGLIMILLFSELFTIPLFSIFYEWLPSSLIVLLVVSLLLFVIFNRRRTQKGYEALDHLRGFKLFLEMTEKDRYAFHNAPEKSPEQFMEYLPYAIAFGVEKEWAKTFESITIPNPGWYDGGGVSSFSAMNLTSSLGGFSTAFAASSGASPSSGGGSSGGGSGGGGGGSW